MIQRRHDHRSPKAARSSIDWENAFALALSHEARAALLVNASGRVVHANSAAHELLGARARSGQFPWGDEPEGRAQLEKALDGDTTSQIRTRNGSGLAIVLTAATAVVRAKPVPLVLLIVGSWRPAEAAPASGDDIVYDISIREFGKLKRVSVGATSEVRPNGRRCYEAIYHRTTRCTGCIAPTAAMTAHGRTVGAVPAPSPQTGTNLLSAWRLDSDTVRVSARYVSEDLLSTLVRARIDRLAEAAALTAREREVLELVLLGRLPREIATMLRVSVSTAKFHQSNVLQKLGAESRFDLLRLLH